MSRKLLWTLWGLAPLAALAFHLGPGQRLLARDDAGRRVRAASRAISNEQWAEAAASYAAAQSALPEGGARGEAIRLALASAWAKVRAGDLVEGGADIEQLVADEQGRPDADEEFLVEARDKLAQSGYFTAWLMRLDGGAVEEWKPEAEKARQQWRLLAESAEASGDDRAETFKKNVEQVIRLEQMDLSELKALPLPKNCSGNCKGICQKKRDQRLSKCKNPGKNPSDARNEIKTDSAGAAMKRGTGS